MEELDSPELESDAQLLALNIIWEKANFYLDMQELDSLKKYNQLFAKKIEQQNNHLCRPFLFLNQAKEAYLENDLTEAFEWNEEVLDIAIPNNLYPIQLQSLLSLAKIEMKQRDLEKAENFASRGLNIARKINSPLDKYKAQKQLLAIYADLKDSLQVAKTQAAIFALQDSFALTKASKQLVLQALNQMGSSNNFNLDHIEREVADISPKREAFLSWGHYLTIAVLLVVMGIVLFLLYRLKLKNRQLKEQNIDMLKDKNKAVESRENLEHIVMKKNQKLVQQTSLLTKYNKNIKEIDSQLSDLYAHAQSDEALRKKLYQLKQKLRLLPEKEQHFLSEFKLLFENYDPEFFKSLLTISSDLSQNELNHCAFMRICLSPTETADLLHVSKAAIVKARYRVKKKLGLKKGEDLQKFILNL